jgi:hypothetical protein
VTLHPDLTDESDYPTRKAGSVAPFVWDDDNVRPVWETLAERATMLGYVRSQLERTTEAQICIKAHGRTLRPTRTGSGTFAFIIPPGTRLARLRSRADAPTSAKPWLEDMRVLGIHVQRLTPHDPHPRILGPSAGSAKPVARVA